MAYWENVSDSNATEANLMWNVNLESGLIIEEDINVTKLFFYLFYKIALVCILWINGNIWMAKFAS